MRYEECQEWFDIYTKNPEHVSLALILTTTKKVKSRCIIWHKEGKNYYDRIYALNNDINRMMQSCLDKLEYINISDKNIISACKELTISLTKGQAYITRYPYMDTLRYLKNNTLSTSSDNYNLCLTQTNGEGEEHYDDTCAECGDDGELIIPRGSDTYYCTDCARWSEYYGEEICPNRAIRTTHDEWILNDDVRYLHNGDTCHEDNSVRLYNGDYCHEDEEYLTSEEGHDFLEGDHEFVEVEGEWYKIDNPAIIITENGASFREAIIIQSENVKECITENPTF